MNGIELRKRLEELDGKKVSLKDLSDCLNKYTLSKDYYASRTNGILNNSNPVNLAVLEAISNSYDMSLSEFMGEETMTKKEFEDMFDDLKVGYAKKIEDIKQSIKFTDRLNFLLYRLMGYMIKRGYDFINIGDEEQRDATEQSINDIWGTKAGNETYDEKQFEYIHQICKCEDCESLSAYLKTDELISKLELYDVNTLDYSRLSYLQLKSNFEDLNRICFNEMRWRRANSALSIMSIVRDIFTWKHNDSILTIDDKELEADIINAFSNFCSVSSLKDLKYGYEIYTMEESNHTVDTSCSKDCFIEDKYYCAEMFFSEEERSNLFQVAKIRRPAMIRIVEPNSQTNECNVSAVASEDLSARIKELEAESQRLKEENQANRVRIDKMLDKLLS